jgi:hypothetical protein
MLVKKFFDLIVNSENAFSRLKLFKILQIPYRGKREQMHIIANVCAQLTNFNIQYHPLRKETIFDLINEYESGAKNWMMSVNWQ